MTLTASEQSHLDRYILATPWDRERAAPNDSPLCPNCDTPLTHDTWTRPPRWGGPPLNAETIYACEDCGYEAEMHWTYGERRVRVLFDPRVENHEIVDRRQGSQFSTRWQEREG